MTANENFSPKYSPEMLEDYIRIDPQKFKNLFCHSAGEGYNGIINLDTETDIS